jgi:hypothetical protein
MSRPSQVIVLVEDRRQQTFVRRYLERSNYRTDQIRFEPLPAGRGSGEQWVREQYARNVDAYRARAARAATALVVVIDADTAPMGRRVEQLDESAPRRPEERISHLIPRRNIETWVLCLNGRRPDGNPVNEDEDYKAHEDARDIDQQIKPAAETFFNWSRPGTLVPAHCLDSLQRAIREIRRLEP